MARKCPRQIRKIRSVGSILDGFGEHERVSTKNSAYSSRRDDASRRKLSQDRWCHLSRAKFTRLEIEPPFPNRAFHRRFRCTAFLQTYYYRPPSSTPIFANRAMNYSSNRSATDTSCSSAFFTSYDSSR